MGEPLAPALRKRKARRPRQKDTVDGRDLAFRALADWMRPYQRKWFLDDSRLRIALKARQIGWSTTFAIESVIGAWHLGVDQLLVSASEKNAQEVLDRCYKWVKFLDQYEPIKLESHSKTEIAFENGSKILSLAQNPRTARGFTGNVFLDEMAFHAEDEGVYSAIFPAASLGYRVSVASTPLGQLGKFYEIWNDVARYPDYSRHVVDIYQAVEDGCPTDIEFIRRNTDDEDFAQNYLCQFIDDAVSYLPFDLIRGCVGESRGGEGAAYCGVDVGRHRDATVVYVLRQLGDKFYTERMEIFKGETFARQKEEIIKICKDHGVVGGRVDCTGPGMQLAEELEQELGYFVGVNFTGPEVKNDMAVRLKRFMEEGRLQIPPDRDLMSDMHRIKRSVTPSNRIKIDAGKSKKEGHADRFWALCLALEAAGSEVEPVISWI